MKHLLVTLVLLSTFACNKKDSSNEEVAVDPAVNSVVATPGPIDVSPVTEITPKPVTEVTAPILTFTEQFMNLVNDHRKSKGLKALVHNNGLAEIASEHSENMAIGITPFGHLGFSTRCSDASEVLGGSNWCAENVAKGQKTPQAAFSAWMNSPGHRANIESSKATNTGFSYAKNNLGTYYWTQIFVQLN